MAKKRLLFESRSKTGQAITGVAAFTAVAGMGVTIADNGGTDADPTLELANEVTGYPLTRDIVSAADYKAELLAASQFGSERDRLGMPTKEGEAATAQQSQFAEYEGSALLDASVDENTVVDAELYWKNGKLAEVDAAQTPACRVKSQLGVEDDANSCRILVEFIL